MVEADEAEIKLLARESPFNEDNVPRGILCMKSLKVKSVSTIILSKHPAATSLSICVVYLASLVSLNLTDQAARLIFSNMKIENSVIKKFKTLLTMMA